MKNLRVRKTPLLNWFVAWAACAVLFVASGILVLNGDSGLYWWVELPALFATCVCAIGFWRQSQRRK